MSNPSPDYQAPGPLSVGNVVNAAARIYRDRFAVYYKLALTAYFWLLVPIYGWAKFMAISGLLSRLAYGEVSGQPESVTEARRYINPRLWTFFGTAFLVGLIFFGGYLIFGIIAAIILGVVAALASQDGLAFLWIIFGLLVIVAVITFVMGIFWLTARLYLADLAIAIENKSSASKAINRSWQLTKQFIWRIMLVSFVASLLTMPVSLLVNFLDSLLSFIFSRILPEDIFFSVIFNRFYSLIYLVLYFAMIAFLVPFWQAIKAVIYYDLRIRKEGIDIQLRDSI